MSLERYQKFHQEQRSFNVYIRLVKGKVITYEIPSPPHAALVAELILIIEGWTNHRLMIYIKLDMTVGNNNDTEYCTDIAIEPRHILTPETRYIPQPRMIIEVGKTESIRSLDSLAGEYFSNSVQSSLIQVSNLALNQPNPSPNITPIVTMANTIPNLIISFGTVPLHQESLAVINNTRVRNDRIIGFLQPNNPACMATGMPNYQINIPSNLLFCGYPEREH
ncbi:hypothetical protein C1645_818924 [Glomus cerebriforme]|uniref:Restriction endonuclease domain-containing protein n=1 Tax=Glomus cerebriforme TaxID=658196 RepID=A0A397T680_9GLOM|nr:hypothetical protein C1645_818924 [Glomus cerebriforme]